jgi:negative regulator of flagellin synthesis FlgM
MKIESNFKPTATSVQSRPASTQATPAPAAQEAVSLSLIAGSMQSSEKPPVNTARIQEIKQAISEGRFKINPEAIADRLIESARELVNSSGKRQA